MPPETFDPISVCPIFRRDLKMSVAKRDGELVHLIEDPVSGKVFQVGVEESAFFLSMDGTLSLSKYAADPLSALNEEQAKKLYQWGHAKCLWQDSSELAIERDRAAFGRVDQQKYSRWLNPISIQIPFGCPAKWFQRFGPSLQWLFSGWVVAIWIVLAIISLGIIYTNASEFSRSTGESLANGGWIAMLVTWLIAKVFHESAHAIACQRYGVRVSDCGVILILFMPLAYVDVSGCNRLSGRWQRIVVSAAGVYLELMFTFAAIILWCAVEHPTARIWLQAWIVTSGVTTVLFNVNPLMKYDGYYVLSDWLDISNLSTRGRNQFWNSIAKYCMGIPVEDCEFSGWRSSVIWIYGLLSIIWRVLLTFTLILAASAMFHGAGIIVALVAGTFTILNPMLGLYQKCKTGGLSQWKMRNTLASSAILVVSVIMVFHVLTGPVWLSAPAIVQDSHLTTVRAEASGFVEKVLFDAEQNVSQGEPLIILRNDELEVAVNDLEMQLEQAEVRQRMNRQKGLYADAVADRKEIDGLQRTLAEKKSEWEQLTVRASCDGRLNIKDPAQLLGTYIERGRVLFNIDSELKEVLLSISQDNLPSVQRNFDQPVQVLLTGFPEFRGRFSTLIPNASYQLPSPALAAVHGGALSVRQIDKKGNQNEAWFHNGSNNSESVELTEPRFVAKVTIDKDVGCLPAGQTGLVYFQSVKRSLGTYWYLSARQWLRSHLPRIL